MAWQSWRQGTCWNSEPMLGWIGFTKTFIYPSFSTSRFPFRSIGGEGKLARIHVFGILRRLGGTLRLIFRRYSFGILLALVRSSPPIRLVGGIGCRSLIVFSCGLLIKAEWAWTKRGRFHLGVSMMLLYHIAILFLLLMRALRAVRGSFFVVRKQWGFCACLFSSSLAHVLEPCVARLFIMCVISCVSGRRCSSFCSGALTFLSTCRLLLHYSSYIGAEPNCLLSLIYLVCAPLLLFSYITSIVSWAVGVCGRAGRGKGGF